MRLFSMLFPGQGSQYINMLSSFFQKKNKIFENTFNEASEYINFNLLKLIRTGPQKILNYSKYAQPAILASSIAIYRFWRKKDGRYPAYMSGHSLGEYSALVCSNAMKFSDAIKIVFLRGQWMHNISLNKSYCTKAIIGLNQKKIKNILLHIPSKYIFIASINSNNQIIISGDKLWINQAIIHFKKNGATHIFDLNINFPVHSILMQPIAKKLKKILTKVTITSPKIPIINNVDVKCEFNSLRIKKALVKQVYSTVRWNEIINKIRIKKIFLMLEIGPNKILTNLNRKNKDITAFSTHNLKNFFVALKKINNNHEY